MQIVHVMASGDIALIQTFEMEKMMSSHIRMNAGYSMTGRRQTMGIGQELESPYNVIGKSK